MFEEVQLVFVMIHLVVVLVHRIVHHGYFLGGSTLELDILKPAYRIVLGVAKKPIRAEFEGIRARLKGISKASQAIHQRLF